MGLYHTRSSSPRLRHLWMSTPRRWQIYTLLLGLTGLTYFAYNTAVNTCNGANQSFQFIEPKKFVIGSDGRKFEYNNNLPLIFIGGMPRSGTTLVRVLLDAHPDIRCGEETRIIPRLLGLKQQWVKNPLEMNRLLEGGITPEVIDAALSAFILEVIVRHGKPAPRLCNKDPFTLRAAVYLHHLFPKAKFLLMLRDGRAVVHSIITRQVTITGYDLSSYRQCLKKWNAAMSSMHTQCQQLGPNICMPVYYEQLVLHPKLWLEKILKFVDVPWNDSVLHHDQFVNKPGGISLSMLERSTDQVIKPINIEALSKWVGAIPPDVVRDMAKIAPMLATFGYDPQANPPNYGKPDSFVLNNTHEIKRSQDEWRVKEVLLEQHRQAVRKGVMEQKEHKASSEVPPEDGSIKDS